jgi:sodium/proline symporter
LFILSALMTCLAIVAIYCVVMLSIGFFEGRKQSSFTEYILGNRSFGPFVIGMSYLSSEISVGTFTVAVSMIYKSGFSRIWIDAGLLLFTILCWNLVAKRLRLYSENFGNSLTIPQYFSHRFKSNAIGVISALVITFFLTFYIAANLLGFVKVMTNMLAIPKVASYFIGFLITVIYVTAGGFRAACLTDVVQGLMMLFASLILPISLAFKFGLTPLLGAVDIHTQASMINDGNGDLMNALLYFGFGLFLFGSPHTVTKFMAIKSHLHIKSARNISIFLNLVMYAGLVIAALYAVTAMSGIKDSEVVLFELSKSFLHPVISGIVVSAMVAAMMSTVDSQIILCSSCLVNDVYKNYTKNHSDRHLINVSRMLTVAVSSVALLLSVLLDQSVLKLGIFALTGLGSSIGPVMLISLYKSNVDSISALCGILSGFTLTILFFLFVQVHDAHHILLPAFCVSTAVMLACSFLLGKNKKGMSNKNSINRLLATQRI